MVLDPCEEDGGREDANTRLDVDSTYPIHDEAMNIDMEIDLVLSAGFC